MRVFLFLIVLGISIPSLSSAHLPAPNPIQQELKGKEKVSFTLRNKSLKSIPLIIPGVMKPNLSPVSNSGVTLKVGQKIIYKFNGRRKVLLVVDKSLEGKKLDVAKLIREKKRSWRENSRD